MGGRVGGCQNKHRKGRLKRERKKGKKYYQCDIEAGRNFDDIHAFLRLQPRVFREAAAGVRHLAAMQVRAVEHPEVLAAGEEKR